MTVEFPEVLIPSTDVALFATAILLVLLSALVGTRYFVLLSYHTYLLYVGLGTYDFMLHVRNQEFQRRKELEKKQEEAQGKEQA